jgi:hypothetical protein
MKLRFGIVFALLAVLVVGANVGGSGQVKAQFGPCKEYGFCNPRVSGGGGKSYAFGSACSVFGTVGGGTCTITMPSTPTSYFAVCEFYFQNTPTVSTVTLAGQTLTAIQNSCNNVYMYAGNVTGAGGAQTFTVNTSTTANFFELDAGCWAVSNLTSTTVEQDPTWASGSGTVSVLNNDFMFAVAWQPGGGTSTWASSTVTPNNVNTYSGVGSATVTWADWEILSSNRPRAAARLRAHLAGWRRPISPPSNSPACQRYRSRPVAGSSKLASASRSNRTRLISSPCARSSCCRRLTFGCCVIAERTSLEPPTIG